jgi:hypothetical protein
MDKNGGFRYVDIRHNWPIYELEKHLWNVVRFRPEFQGNQYKKWFNDLISVVENCNIRKLDSTDQCFKGGGHKESHEAYTKALGVVAVALRNIKKAMKI